MIGWLLALPCRRRLGLWLAAAGAFLAAALAALRRSGERSGSLEEKLEQERRCPIHISDCSMRRAIVVAGVTISLGGCATARSERASVACVPVPQDSQQFLDREVDQVERLPEGAVVVQMLENHAVMRAQGRNACTAHRLVHRRHLGHD